MKKIVLVLALAALLVFAGASVALAKNGGSKVISISGTSTPDGWSNLGYLNWRTASVGAWATALSAGSLDAAEAAGPHADYTTTTVKCAVCHSVHLAPQDSFLLTKVTNTAISGGGGTAEAVCRYCHYDANTLGIKAVAFGLTKVPEQHSTKCTAADGAAGCHASAHGVGVSHYDTLAAALLGSSGDAEIAAAISATANTGLVAGDFDLVGSAAITGDQRTLRVAYTCAKPGCHRNSAFASLPGKSFSVNAPGGSGTSGYKSAHPMFADGEVTSALTSSTPPGASFTGQIAWTASRGDANGSACSKCHALVDPNVTSIVAFPHDRFTKQNGIWLVAAAYFGDTLTNVSNHEYGVNDSNTGIAVEFGMSTLRDGVCLRCHRSATAGVGVTF